MRSTLIGLTSGLILTCGALSAQASPIVTFGGSPAGMTFTIESVVPTSDLFLTDLSNDTYLVTLQLQTTTAYVPVGSDPNYLESLALDVGGASAVDAADLNSAPAGGLSWAFAANIGVNGSGACNGTNNGALCVEEDATGTNLAIDANAVYQWVFKVDLPATGFASSTALTFAIATTKMNGPNITWDTPVLASGTLTAGALQPGGGGTNGEVPAPEPASLLLFGTGAALLARRVRRSKV